MRSASQTTAIAMHATSTLFTSVQAISSLLMSTRLASTPALVSAKTIPVTNKATAPQKMAATRLSSKVAGRVTTVIQTMVIELMPPL